MEPVYKQQKSTKVRSYGWSAPALKYEVTMRGRVTAPKMPMETIM